ncbi:hypothetical protein D3C85_1628500 [compost metagenome]
MSSVRLSQFKGQQAVTAREVPLPQSVAGVIRRSRMEHPFDLGVRLQPMGDFQRPALMGASAGHTSSRVQTLPMTPSLWPHRFVSAIIEISVPSASGR